MKVVHIASEMSPMAKIGGLADVVLGLSSACAEAGLKTSVIIPAYPQVKKSFLSDTKPETLSIDGILKAQIFKKKLIKLLYTP